MRQIRTTFERTPFLARLEVVDKVTDTVAAAKAQGEAATKEPIPYKYFVTMSNQVEQEPITRTGEWQLKQL